MIIDVHRHLVLKGTVQGASRSYSMMYNKAHQTHLSPREYIDEVMRKEIDEHADNIVEEMDKAGVDVSVTFGVDYGLAFGEAPIHREMGVRSGFPSQTPKWGSDPDFPDPEIRI